MTSIWKLVEAELSPEVKAKLDLAEKNAAAKLAAAQSTATSSSTQSNTPSSTSTSNSQRNSNVQQKRSSSHHNKSKGSNNGRGKSSNSSRRGYSSDLFYPDTPETREYFAKMAVKQIEYLLSVDNLCMDTFLRSFMDEAGFIPIAYLCNYPAVAACGAYYESIIKVLSESELFEMDIPNQTMRLKEKWQQVLYIALLWVLIRCI